MRSQRPHPLQEGERVELWLPLPPDHRSPWEAAENQTCTSQLPEEAQEAQDVWDVRPARIGTTSGQFVAAVAGGWGMLSSDNLTSGMPALIQRSGPDGVAEWECTVVPSDAPEARTLIQRTDRHTQEVVLVLHLGQDRAAGDLQQRRRSPRLSLRMLPARLMPLLPSSAAANALAASNKSDVSDVVEGDDFAPVTRLTDVSATGAAVVIDTPLDEGALVVLEFELPGERLPFSVRGRIVHPAVALHGDVRPQPDGLPGFRRGVEFLTFATPRDRNRLHSAISHLLARSK